MSMMWLVCDMDDGVLRREPTKRAAKEWFWHCLVNAPSVDALHVRRQLDGSYWVSYWDGASDYSSSATIVRADVAERTGWDVSQIPLYPDDEHPYERVERAERPAQDSLEQDSLGDAGAVVVALPVRSEESMLSEEELVRELRAAHADQERLAAELVAARQRRREAAAGLRDLRRPMSWIADQIGVTQQAVDGFLKYKERRSRAG